MRRDIVLKELYHSEMYTTPKKQAFGSRIGLAALSQMARYTFTGLNRKRKAPTARFSRVAVRRRLFSRTRTRQRRRMTTGRGVTRDMDRREIYRRKSMPKWKRRKWRRFVKKVQAAGDKLKGTRTYISKPNYLMENVSNTTNQTSTTYALYPVESLNTRLDLLNRIGKAENTGDQSLLEGETVYKSTKFFFKSAIMDLTFTNRSTVNSASPADDDPIAAFCPLEVDLYEITMAKKSTYLDSSGNPQILNTLSACLDYSKSSEIDNEEGFAKRIFSMQSRGLSPWDFTTSLSRFGIKIHKKTKFFLDTGKYFTYQMRDHRNHVITKEKLTETQGFNMPGLTKILYVVMKPVSGVIPDIGTTEGTTRARLFCGQTYKYTYSIEGSTEDRHLVVAS